MSKFNKAIDVITKVSGLKVWGVVYKFVSRRSKYTSDEVCQIIRECRQNQVKSFITGSFSVSFLDDLIEGQNKPD